MELAIREMMFYNLNERNMRFLVVALATTEISKSVAAKTAPTKG